jgi:hypothetical protein
MKIYMERTLNAMIAKNEKNLPIIQSLLNGTIIKEMNGEPYFILQN